VGKRQSAPVAYNLMPVFFKQSLTWLRREDRGEEPLKTNPWPIDRHLIKLHNFFLGFERAPRSMSQCIPRPPSDGVMIAARRTDTLHEQSSAATLAVAQFQLHMRQAHRGRRD
jgi:hypothetical protein